MGRRGTRGGVSARAVASTPIVLPRPAVPRPDTRGLPALADQQVPYGTVTLTLLPSVPGHLGLLLLGPRGKGGSTQQ